MYKIAVIGDRQSIIGFKAVGLECFEVTVPKDAEALVDELCKEGFGVIYITENLFSQMINTVTLYANRSVPTLIPIPGVSGNTGIGSQRLHTAVEKAVGSDIL